jgi:hypothetical protein
MDMEMEMGKTGRKNSSRKIGKREGQEIFYKKNQWQQRHVRFTGGSMYCTYVCAHTGESTDV